MPDVVQIHGSGGMPMYRVTAFSGAAPGGNTNVTISALPPGMYATTLYLQSTIVPGGTPPTIALVPFFDAAQTVALTSAGGAFEPRPLFGNTGAAASIPITTNPQNAFYAFTHATVTVPIKPEIIWAYGCRVVYTINTGSGGNLNVEIFFQRK